jgi:hypothetical protein
MISDDEATPPLIRLPAENGHTPGPLGTPTPVLTALPVMPARSSFGPKRPPLGRPTSSLSVAELVERITQDVRRSAETALELKHAELRAELAARIRSVAGLGLAAIVMNALAIIVSLVFSRVVAARGVAFGVAALTAVFVAAVRFGGRRGPTSPR